MADPKKDYLPVHLDWMIRRHMPEVNEIEQKSNRFPWSEEDFIRCLRQRNCIGMVAEHADRVVGYMIYELHKKRLHLLKFAVHPDFRRQGVGRQMMKKLIDKLAPQRRTGVTLEVPESNLPAQLFLKEMGFEAFNLLKNFYDDQEIPEDAYLMRYSTRKKSITPESVAEAQEKLTDMTHLPWRVVRILYEKPKPLEKGEEEYALKEYPFQLAFQSAVPLDHPATTLKPLYEHFGIDMPKGLDDRPAQITLPLIAVMQGVKKDTGVSFVKACTPHDPADQKLEGFRKRVMRSGNNEQQRGA